MLLNNIVKVLLRNIPNDKRCSLTYRHTEIHPQMVSLNGSAELTTENQQVKPKTSYFLGSNPIGVGSSIWWCRFVISPWVPWHFYGSLIFQRCSLLLYSIRIYSNKRLVAFQEIRDNALVSNDDMHHSQVGIFSRRRGRFSCPQHTHILHS